MGKGTMDAEEAPRCEESSNKCNANRVSPNPDELVANYKANVECLQ